MTVAFLQRIEHKYNKIRYLEGFEHMLEYKNFSLIIVSAGSGNRINSTLPKQYIELNGRSILRHTLDVFMNINEIKSISVVINPEHKDLFTKATRGIDNIECCYGGRTRKDSVYSGIRKLSNLLDNEIILVHDAARPFVERYDIYNLLETMQSYSAASLATPVVDTLRYDGNKPTVSRDNLWAIQTPQAFHYGVLKRAHEEYNDKEYTDDTSLVSEMDIAVKFVKGSKNNFKITHIEDLELAKQILSTEISTEMRVGQGYDVHAFEDIDTQAIRLCGVDIPHNKSLKGHSDADVALHALTDAILGAIGEGDIGVHFPPSNNDFKDMDSANFVRHAMKLMRDKGGRLVNTDITLICERPKISDYRDEILSRLAEIMAVSKMRINIKATTTEKLGFTGRSEGIAAQASVSISLPICED